MIEEGAEEETMFCAAPKCFEDDPRQLARCTKCDELYCGDHINDSELCFACEEEGLWYDMMRRPAYEIIASAYAYLKRPTAPPVPKMALEVLSRAHSQVRLSPIVIGVPF
jgi:hypothetical protein